MQDFESYKINETLSHKYYQIPQELFVNPLYKDNFLTKVINTLEKTIEKFIFWICDKFNISSEDELIREFQKKQIHL